MSTRSDTSKTRRPKIWRLEDKSEAQICLHEEHVSLIANSKNFLDISPKGVLIKGSVSFASMGEARREGGIFLPQNEFVNMIPKTIVTPIPIVMPIPPLGFAFQLVQSVTMAMAFLVA